VTEAQIVDAENGGRMPEGDGWFVLNAKDSRWLDGTLGQYCAWEGKDEAHFQQVGVNLNILQPGVPMAMYHAENSQEGFLVLDGECLAIVEGEERPLKQWDYLHTPPNVPHVVLGAGDRPALVLAIGARTKDDDNLVYPADLKAQKHNAGVRAETRDAKEAYEGMQHEWGPYKEGWLP